MSKISYQNLNQHYGHAIKLEEKILEKKTKYQKLEIYKSSHFGKILLLDDITQIDEKNECFYHEPMAHIPLLSHHQPQSVLIIGGGDGGVLREVLKHKTIQKVDHIELDEDVVNISKEHFPNISNNAWKDPRVNLMIQDGMSYIENTTAVYDVIIMDMTDPFGPSMALYTQKFFKMIQSKLNENGLFFMHTESPVLTPATYGSIYNTLLSVFPHVQNYYTYIQMYGGLWAFSLSHKNASTNNLTKDIYQTRMTSRNLKSLKIITPETIQSMSVEYPYMKEIQKNNTDIIHDNYKGFEEIDPKKSIFNKIT